MTSNRANCIKLIQHTSKNVATSKITTGREETAVVIVSAYFKFNQPTIGFTDKIRNIIAEPSRVVIGADCNGHSPLWFNPNCNNRGLIVKSMIEDLSLDVLNKSRILNKYV